MAKCNEKSGPLILEDITVEGKEKTLLMSTQ